jgi:hypothetical protein
MSMDLDYGTAVAGELLRQSGDLKEAIEHARAEVCRVREMAEELKTQSHEFATSDVAFGRPVVFDAAASQARYIAETLDPETYSDQDAGLVLAWDAVNELTEILGLGIEQLQREVNSRDAIMASVGAGPDD